MLTVAVRRNLSLSAQRLARFWTDLDALAAFLDAGLAQMVVALAGLGHGSTNKADSFGAMQLYMLCSTHSYLVFKTYELLSDVVARGGESQSGPLLAEATGRGRAELKRVASYIKVGSIKKDCIMTLQIIHLLESSSPGPLLWIHFTRL